MKIVHLCLACFYPDGYSYQENMLPKFHKQLGHEVEVIASLCTFDENGKIAYLQNPSIYLNEYGIKVTRLAYKKPFSVFRKLNSFVGLRKAIRDASPDVLFIHGCQFVDMYVVLNYVKIHSNVRVYVDNHADFSNSARNFLSKNILHKLLWRHMAQIIEPYTTKFYGVLPARVDFLKDVYHLPVDKCELLVMGADDDMVHRAEVLSKESIIRKKYGISKDDFLIVTGGKIDLFKKETLLLMEAVSNLEDKIKLLVFGSIVPELKEDFLSLVDGEKVIYAGWIDSKESYNYFAEADLVVFPGRHSVFWEQVAAQGIPMICKYWEGTTHIDVGGNVIFIAGKTTKEIYDNLLKIINDEKLYNSLKRIAKEIGMNRFSYKIIAHKSIEFKN